MIITRGYFSIHTPSKTIVTTAGLVYSRYLAFSGKQVVTPQGYQGYPWVENLKLPMLLKEKYEGEDDYDVVEKSPNYTFKDCLILI